MLTRRGMRGIGDPVSSSSPAVIDTGFGTSANCADWASWLINSGCWKYSVSAWQQMTGFAPPPTPSAPPAVGAGTSSTPAPYACSGIDVTNPYCPEFDAAVTAALKGGQDSTTQNLQAWAGLQVPVADTGSGMPGWLIGALLIGGGIVLLGVFRK
jgi:hypothetical protein